MLPETRVIQSDALGNTLAALQDVPFYMDWHVLNQTLENPSLMENPSSLLNVEHPTVIGRGDLIRDCWPGRSDTRLILEKLVSEGGRLTGPVIETCGQCSCWDREELDAILRRVGCPMDNGIVKVDGVKDVLMTSDGIWHPSSSEKDGPDLATRILDALMDGTRHTAFQIEDHVQCGDWRDVKSFLEDCSIIVRSGQFYRLRKHIPGETKALLDLIPATDDEFIECDWIFNDNPEGFKKIDVQDHGELRTLMSRLFPGSCTNRPMTFRRKSLDWYRSALESAGPESTRTHWGGQGGDSITASETLDSIPAETQCDINTLYEILSTNGLRVVPLYRLVNTYRALRNEYVQMNAVRDTLDHMDGVERVGFDQYRLSGHASIQASRPTASQDDLLSSGHGSPSPIVPSQFDNAIPEDTSDDTDDNPRGDLDHLMDEIWGLVISNRNGMTQSSIHDAFGQVTTSDIDKAIDALVEDGRLMSSGIHNYRAVPDVDITKLEDLFSDLYGVYSAYRLYIDHSNDLKDLGIEDWDILSLIMKKSNKVEFVPERISLISFDGMDLGDTFETYREKGFPDAKIVKLAYDERGIPVRITKAWIAATSSGSSFRNKTPCYMTEGQRQALSNSIEPQVYLESELERRIVGIIPELEGHVDGALYKELGFKKAYGYVYPNSFDNIYDALLSHISKKGCVSFNPDDLKGAPLHPLKDLLKERKILQYDVASYIPVERLHSAGVDKTDLDDLLIKICIELDGVTFTIKTLRKRGWTSKIENLGFGDEFIEYLLSNSDSLYEAKIGNGKAYNTREQPKLWHIIDYIMKEEARMDLPDLVDRIYEEYGITVKESSVKRSITSNEIQSLYYNDIIDKVYRNKEEFRRHMNNE